MDFVGNVFDYINPDADLNIVLPLLCEYFAMFFFKTEQAAAKFEELVKPFVTGGLFVHTHVVNDVDQERLRNLVSFSMKMYQIKCIDFNNFFFFKFSQPINYESLASHVLSEETQEQHPLIKNWFDNFRVNRNVTTVKDKAHRNLALKYKCKIIDGDTCYHENGHGISKVSNGKPDNELKVFLEKWQLAAAQRDDKLQEQVKCVDNNHVLAKLQTENHQLKEQRLNVKKTIK